MVVLRNHRVEKVWDFLITFWRIFIAAWTISINLKKKFPFFNNSLCVSRGLVLGEYVQDIALFRAYEVDFLTFKKYVKCTNAIQPYTSQNSTLGWWGMWCANKLVFTKHVINWGKWIRPMKMSWKCDSVI